MAKADKENELSLEENFDKLEEITAALSSDDISLEDAFEDYKKGMDLIRKCSEQIDAVEKEVLRLNADMSTEEI